MLKVPSRTQRSKGFKLKHVIQACLLLAICIWLLNQVKHSYDKRKAYVEGAGTLSEEVHSVHETIKLGRKDLDPQVQASTSKIRGNTQKEDLGDAEETKHEESEDEGRGGGDDEIDGHDQEKAEDDEPEEVEDLIDEEDRERGDESEELETDEKGHQSEVTSSLEDHVQYEGERNSQEAREEHYKGDDASSAVVHSTHTTSNLFEIGGLRKLKEEETENTENVKLEHEKKKNGIKEDNADMNGLRNPEHGEDKDDELNLANLDIGSRSNSSIEAEANEKPELKSNSRSILTENLSSLKGIGILSEPIHDANVTSNTRKTFSQAVVREQNGKSGRTVENEPSNFNFNLTLSTTIVNLDAAKRDMAANLPSESITLEQIVKLNTDEVLLASLTTSENTEAAQNESLDLSDSSFYQDD